MTNQEALVEINDLLSEVFNSLEEQLKWLETPNPMLNGEIPGEWIMDDFAVALLRIMKEDKAFNDYNQVTIKQNTRCC